MNYNNFELDINILRKKSYNSRRKHEKKEHIEKKNMMLNQKKFSKFLYRKINRNYINKVKETINYF